MNMYVTRNGSWQTEIVDFFARGVDDLTAGASEPVYYDTRRSKTSCGRAYINPCIRYGLMHT